MLSQQELQKQQPTQLSRHLTSKILVNISYENVSLHGKMEKMFKAAKPKKRKKNKNKENLDFFLSKAGLIFKQLRSQFLFCY